VFSPIALKTSLCQTADAEVSHWILGKCMAWRAAAENDESPAAAARYQYVNQNDGKLTFEATGRRDWSCSLPELKIER